jgi:hypothetical protein
VVADGTALATATATARTGGADGEPLATGDWTGTFAGLEPGRFSVLVASVAPRPARLARDRDLTAVSPGVLMRIPVQAQAATANPTPPSAALSLSITAMGSS